MNVHIVIVGTIGQLFIAHIITISGYCPAPSPPIEDPTQIPDYYWRDYTGIIPQDAIEGGTDADGNPTYIGQVYLQNKILPAVITRGCAIAKTTANGEFITTDEDIKILCSQHKENFEWVPSQDIHSLTDCHLIIGGRTRRHILYIGRTYYDSRLIIGKVIHGDLVIPYKGTIIVVQTYEVLTYYVGKQTDSMPLGMDIDVRSQ